MDCFTATVANGIEEPYFSKSPKNVDVIRGKSVTLLCEVTPSTGMRYYWELNGNFCFLLENNCW